MKHLEVLYIPKRRRGKPDAPGRFIIREAGCMLALLEIEAGPGTSISETWALLGQLCDSFNAALDSNPALSADLAQRAELIRVEWEREATA